MLNYNFLLKKYFSEFQCDCFNNSYDAITCYDASVEKPSKEQFEEWWEESKDEYLQLEENRKKISDLRKSEYPSIEEMVIALWERVIEEKQASAIDIQNIRILVKEKYQYFSPSEPVESVE